MNKIAKLASVAAVGALVLSGCAANEPATPESPNGSAGGEALSGTLTGIGASSMQAAQERWVADFMTQNSGVQVSYAPEGSGAGREAFMGGGADFAGSDRALTPEENVAGSFGKCAEDSIAYEMPAYISPIAIVFNVEGVDELNLNADVTGRIFDGQITNWNDPAIAEINPDATLPDLPINPVHRSDDSGTTENFTGYLNEVAPEAWPHEADGEWPIEGGEGAQGTSGVVAAVSNGNGTIGYADASQAQDLSQAKVGEEGNFSELTPEAAAQIVENSPLEEGREEHDLAIELDRAGEGYPIVLVSYAIACQTYQDPAQAELVKAYLTYITSEEGQAAAAESAGAAPLSPALTEQVTAAIEAIS